MELRDKLGTKNKGKWKKKFNILRQNSFGPSLPEKELVLIANHDLEMNQTEDEICSICLLEFD